MNNAWKVILATMVIFGAGVVTGGLLVRQTIFIRPPKPPHSATAHTPSATAHSTSPALGSTRVEFLKRAERELDLTPEQRAQADKIMADSQDRMKKLMEPVNPKIREELKQTRDQFRAILNPAQQARFDEMMKKGGRPRDLRRPPPPATGKGAGEGP